MLKEKLVWILNLKVKSVWTLHLKVKSVWTLQLKVKWVVSGKMFIAINESVILD